MAAVPAALNLGIAAFVLVRMRLNALTYVFSLFVLAMAVWQTSEACTRAAETVEVARTCRQLLSPGGLTVAPLGMHFALLFAEKRHLAHSAPIMVLLYGPAIIFEVLNRAGFNYSNLVFDAWWGWQLEPPPSAVATASSYWTILLTFGTLLVLTSFAARLPPEDDRKNQARLVATGLAIPLVIGAALQVVLPTVFHQRSIPLTSAALTIFSLATVVALRNHRFLSLPTIEERLLEAHQIIADQRSLLAQAEGVAHLGSWEWDIADNSVLWSPELYRIFDLDPDEFEATYEAYLGRVHPADQERVNRIIQRALESKDPFDFDHRIVLPDGSERAIHARGRVHADESGQPVRMNGTAQDVTRRREVERVRAEADERAREVQRLRDLNRFKTHFINTAAHELSTPLTPLRAMLYTMKKQAAEAGSEELSANLHVFSRNVDRLSRLVSDLLDASRIEAEKIGLNRRRIDLSTVTGEALVAFEAKATDAGVELVAELAPGVPVNADPDRLTQVIFNLVSNALMFTPAGGRVVVSTARTEDGARLRVRDTGVGIARDAQRNLFRPFSRAHLERDPDQPGTGLGLYIAKGIVDLHGGRISVESQGEDQGSTFTVLLPVAGATATPA